MKTTASGPITSWQIDREKVETVTDFIFLGSKITEDDSHKIKRCLLLGRNAMTNLRQRIKKQRHNLVHKGPYGQTYGFSSSQFRCESWIMKKAECWGIDAFETVVLDKTLDSPSDCKEIKPVNLKGNQPWIFTGRTDAEVEAPVLWPPDAKSQLIRKDPDAGIDWRQEEKGAIEDEMVGWCYWLNGHEFEQTQRDSEVQGSLVCYSPQNCEVRHDLVTEQQQLKLLRRENTC